jgi:cell division protein FtsQ
VSLDDEIGAADEGGRATGLSLRPPQVPKWKRRLRAIGVLIGGVALISSPWWYRPLLSNLSFFRVRRVEVVGARYANPDEIVSRLRVDSAASVWDDVGPLEDRVRRHPSVREVRISRKLPGTLVVQVTENPPVALVQAGGSTGGLVTVDQAGRTLPVDPTAVDVDLPVLRSRDTLALRLLGEVREALPALFARIGDVQRTPAGDLAIRLNEPGARLVLASVDLSVNRLSEIIPVELDLARRKAAATEIDLRFRDQVIARLP